MTAGTAVKKGLFFFLVAAIVLYAVFPFYYAILSSLKSGTELFRVDYFPLAWNFDNYVSVFRDNPFATNIWNSILVAFATVALSLFVGLTAAYALARIRFRGRGLLLMTVLGVSMFPQVAVLSGMFELIRALGLYNRAIGLVVPYTIFTLPFTVWILTTFMRQLPGDLEEAAIMDGCGPLRIVFQVFMPLLWPALVSTGLLAFIGAWNEFLFALTLTKSMSMRTVPIGIELLMGQHAFEWNEMMAMSVLGSLPLLLIYLFAQRYFLAGMTAGSVKA